MTLNINKSQLLLLALIALFTSCDPNEEIIAPIPLIDIEFSAPPIDLQGINAQFAGDISYDEYDLTKFDIFIPNSSTKTGLVIYIHGGGFTTSDKNWIYRNADRSEDIRKLLRSGVAVASINYRLLGENETEGVLKPLNDSKRALQYIRYIHHALNISKDDIILYGRSAGAGTSLWIASHDDMRILDHPDAVLRESTRVKGIALNATQAGYNLERRWVNDVLSEFNISWRNIISTIGKNRLFQFYGVGSLAEYNSPEIAAYRREIDMLSFLSSDDPEMWIQNTDVFNGMPQGMLDLNHHPFHAREIKAYADAAGVATVCQYGNPVLYSDPDFGSYVDFALRKLRE